MGSACTHYRDLTKSKNLCYELSVPKLVGMGAEECVLLAIALDLECGTQNCSILMDDLIEIGVEVKKRPDLS